MPRIKRRPVAAPAAASSVPASPSDDAARRRTWARQLSRPPWPRCDHTPPPITWLRWYDSADTLATAEDGTPLRERLPARCCLDVVQADVARSLFTVPDEPPMHERRVKRRMLREAMCRVFADDASELHYFQGVHDVISVVLSVCSTPGAAAPDGADVDIDEATHLAWLVLQRRFQRFAMRDMSVTNRVLRAMHSVIAAEAPTFAARLEELNMGPDAHYALSWAITWFSHVLGDEQQLLRRIFDHLIATDDDLGVMYLSAAFVLHYRSDLEADESIFQPDAFGELFVALQTLPRLILVKKGCKASALRTRAGDEPRRPRKSQMRTLEGVIESAQALRERHAGMVAAALEGDEASTAAAADDAIDDEEPSDAPKRSNARRAMAGVMWLVTTGLFIATVAASTNPELLA